MTLSFVFSLILAILGLGFLIFIHELAHYFVARRCKMTVEVFSIGFGKPLLSWTLQGVRWQIGSIPFGGYVKIAGMEKTKGVEPHQIPGGYFSKSPLARIAVALAGPISNILFAFAAFSCIWFMGGYQKPFVTTTNVIGAMDRDGALYAQGVRSGDKLTSIGSSSFQGFHNLLIKLMLEKKVQPLHGLHIDYLLKKETPFTAELPPKNGDLSTPPYLGIAPAQFLLFEEPLSPNAPITQTTIQKGDRIIWANGEITFSQLQLQSILNSPKVLVSVERAGKTLLFSIPRLKISDLQSSKEWLAELDDLRHLSAIKEKLTNLYFIPYNLDPRGVVENAISYVDEKAQLQSGDKLPLQPGDKLSSVDGVAIFSAVDLFREIQVKKGVVIVDRKPLPVFSSAKDADQFFTESFPSQDLEVLLANFGTPLGKTAGTLHLLTPIPLISLSEIPLDQATKTLADQKKKALLEQLQTLPDEKEKQAARESIEKNASRLVLGAQLQDYAVTYNPSPIHEMRDVMGQTFATLGRLFDGSVSPKQLTGPIGIVEQLQKTWLDGFKSGLRWLAFISLNLACLNLLPIPVLDGGHILFAAIEGILRRPIPTKTLEKFIVPFWILLIVFFIYVSYHDLIRLFSSHR